MTARCRTPTYRLLLLLSCGETEEERGERGVKDSRACRQTDRQTGGRWRGQTGESVLCRTDRGERVGGRGGGGGGGGRGSPAFTFLKKAIRFSFARGDVTVFGLALGERRLTGSSCSSGSKSVASMSMATHTDRQRAPSHREVARVTFTLTVRHRMWIIFIFIFFCYYWATNETCKEKHKARELQLYCGNFKSS